VARRNGAGTPESALSPRQALRRAATLRREALRTEAQALRRALQESAGFERRAVVLLGIGRTTLRYMLETRHQAVQVFAAALRTSAGYTRGKPRV
jgi:DNA-binding NtrC family response regulator